MPATSAYLNRPLRPLVVALRDILAARISPLEVAENMGDSRVVVLGVRIPEKNESPV